jgi:multicomponent Na+:H+ antiporter subunit D
MIPLAPVFFVMMPIVTSIIIYLVKSDRVVWLAFVSQIVSVVLFVLYALGWKDGLSPVIVFGGWDARFAISFRTDRLTLLFVGMSLLMWSVVLLYLFKKHRREHVFLFFILFLQGVFMGLVQTDDLFNMFVFLELTTVLVTILIAYAKSGNAIRAAIYYLLLNTVGAMFFLVGIIILYYVFGTINISMLSGMTGIHKDEALVRLAFVMMVSGISVKAALFPLFFWLPRAHGVARTPISALLSGLVVKGGVYMFIRVGILMFPDLSVSYTGLFFWMGALTGLTGVILAIVQKRFKLILAYHTVSQVGIIMMGLSQTSGLSFEGGLLHVLNHGLFKGLLFLTAGVIIHAYKTNDVYAIKGVMKTMPLAGTALLVGILSITGAPFFNGYVSKALIATGLGDDTMRTVAYTLINISTVTSFVKVGKMLIGPKVEAVARPDASEIASMMVLVAGCLALGLFHVPLGQMILGKDLSYVKLFNMGKWLDYAIYVVIGTLLYQFVVRRDPKPLKGLRELSVGFEDANTLFLVYLAAMSAFVVLAFV